MATDTQQDLEQAIEEILADEERVQAEVDAADEEVGAAEAVGEAAEGSGSEEEADPEARVGIDEPDESLMEPPEGPEDARTAGFRTVGKLAGAPLYYERGVRPRAQSFQVATAFLPLLERAARDVKARAPKRFGRLERISTAGLYVGKAGAHGRGHAMDWDRLVWDKLEIAPIERAHDSRSAADRRRYWGVAAILRSHAAYLLHGEYDAAHGDHLHFDNTGPFGFQTSSRASVTLVQSVCNEIHGQSPKLGVDGDFGTRSRQAVARALDRLRLEGGIEDPAVFRAFLKRSGSLGLRR